MIEYYIEYYDPKGRRGYTRYYLDKREADNKAEDLTVKKLVRNNPTMKEKFDALEEE